MAYSLAQWEHDTLSAHIDREDEESSYPPVVELSNGRWFDTEKKRIIPDAEGFRREAVWNRETPYWEQDAAIMAWRERK